MAHKISDDFEIEQLTWENIGDISRRTPLKYSEVFLMDLLRDAYLNNAVVMVTIWRTAKLN